MSKFWRNLFVSFILDRNTYAKVNLKRVTLSGDLFKL